MTKGFMAKIFLLASMLACALPAVAQDAMNSVSTVKLVELFRSLVRDIDPMAQVGIQEVQSNQTTYLPGTPFVTASGKASKRSRNDLAEQLDIRIFTQNGTLSNSMIQLIKSIAGNYAATVNIKIEKISDELLAAQQASIEAANKNRNGAASVADEKIKQIFAQGSEVLGAMIQSYHEGGLRRYSVIFLGFLCLITILLPIIFIVLHVASQQRMLQELRDGFRSLSSTIESSHGGSSAAMSSYQQQQALGGAPQSIPMLSSPNSFSEMTDDGLLALLTDCYWAYQDHYGSYLWHRIPVNRKLKMIEQVPELGEYGAFIAQLPEVDLGNEQDPSLLSPQPIWYLDMDLLTQFIRANPAAMHLLSPVRLMALKLRPSERMELYHRAENQSAKKFDWPKERCPARILKRSMRMQVNSDEEEAEILAMPNPSFELMEQVPSLGWLLRLPTERISQLLQDFSARDLASAWVGPKEVLELLMPYVGVKKQALMMSILEKTPSSRESPVYSAIHRVTLDGLKSLQSDKKEGQTHAAA